MESANIPETACLPPGTEVGPWRVVLPSGPVMGHADRVALRAGSLLKRPVR